MVALNFMVGYIKHLAQMKFGIIHIQFSKFTTYLLVCIWGEAGAEQ